MDDIPSSKDAYLKFKGAFTAILDEYTAARDHRIEATDPARKNLEHAHHDYLSTSKNARDFFDMKIQQVTELQEVLHTNALDTNQLTDRLVSLVKRQGNSESEARYAGAADVSEEHNTAVSQAVPEETVEQNKAVQWVLPDLDPEKKA